MKTATRLLLLFGCLVTVGAMWHAGGGPAGLLTLFLLWALLPYFILFFANRWAALRGVAIAVLVMTALATLFAAVAYYDALFVSVSSTSALAFVFVPLLQCIGALGVLAAAFLTRKRLAQAR